jgi:hypothetical protein
MENYEKNPFAGALLRNKTSQVSERYFNTWFTMEDLILKRNHITFNDSIQREYLFSDVRGAAGDMWQRNLFLSILKGEPIGQAEFWFTEGRVESLDAQQRMKTELAIADDCVKLPKGSNVDGYDVSELHYSSLPNHLVEKFLKYPFNACVAVEITKDEAVDRFKKLNDSNALTHQDKRSPEQHPLAKYIQEVSHHTRSPFKFSQMVKINDSLKLKHFGFPHKGRVLEEQIAYFFACIYHGKIVNKNQTVLNNMYHDVNIDETKFKKSNVSEFESVIKTLDKIITSKSYASVSKPKGTQNVIKKGDLIQILLLIQRIQKDGGKINSDDFLKYYIISLNKARANKTLKYTFNGETTDFRATWRLGSDAGAIEWINDILFNELDDDAYTSKDTKRQFSEDEINQKHQEQKCSCGYCGTSLKLEDSIGDHKHPHAQGGKTEYSNLVVSCKSCNNMKGSLPYDGWVWAVYGMSSGKIDLRDTI